MNALGGEPDGMAQSLPKIRVPVSLRRLLPMSSFVGCADVRVSEATDNSCDCTAGVLFAAIPGSRCDGVRYVGEAAERGAAALLVERPLPGISLPQCVVRNVRPAYAELCAALHGNPTRQLGVVGVTGTNGKSTVCWLIRSILEAARRQTGLLGTIQYSDGLVTADSTLTTPDSRTLSEWLATMVRRRTTHVALELSSHALDQYRAAGTLLDAAVVTNVTQDHFDYHGDFDSYRASKRRIFDQVKPGGRIVLNADDPVAAGLCSHTESQNNIVTYGLETQADVSATILEQTGSESRFELSADGRSIEVCTALVGRHNVSNCLAAAAATLQFGISLNEIAAGIEALTVVPGRLERIDCGQPFSVHVDYAHTDDALRQSVRSLRELSSGRILCVFGAGGDRDRSKRPLLGRAAAEADLAIITSDNPRTEDSHQIIQDILGGFDETSPQPHVEVDRAAAIRWALDRAEPGDSVLVAGKGHEVEQIVGDERIPFDDRAVIREFLSQRTEKREPLRMPA